MTGRLRALSETLPPQQRLEADLAWGAAASLAGDPVGAETVKAALGTGKVRSVMESAAPSAACSMLARAFDTLLYMECFEEADELFAVAWEVAERQGAFTTMSMLAVIGAAGFWWRGRLRAAFELLGSLAEMSSGLGVVPPHLDQVVRAMIATETGDLGTATSLADRAEHRLLTDPSTESPWDLVQLLRIRGELALDAGKDLEAVEMAVKMRELAQRTGTLQPLWTPWADTAMEAFLRAKMLDDCRALVDHLEQVSSGWACRWPRSVAASGRAGVAEAIGDLAEAERQHVRAVGLLEGIDLPPHGPRADLLRALSPPQRPSGARPCASGPSARGVRGLQRHAPGIPGEGRARGQRGAAPAGELGPVEPPRAPRCPACRPRCHQRRDSLPPVHFGQDG